MSRHILALATVLALSVSAPALADPTQGSDAQQDLLYTALCRGILWPDGRPTLLASDGPIADVALEIATRDALARAAETDPSLADDLAAEAAGGSDWRSRARTDDPGQLAQVQGECRIHLEGTVFAQ